MSRRPNWMLTSLCPKGDQDACFRAVQAERIETLRLCSCAVKPCSSACMLNKALFLPPSQYFRSFTNLGQVSVEFRLATFQIPSKRRASRNMANQAERVRVSPDSIYAFAAALFSAAGVPPDYAAFIADALLLADLRGVDTHGINRVPVYLSRVKNGVVNPSPELSFVMKTPVMAHLDAQNTYGFIAGNLAMRKGVEIAKTYGFGVVGVKNSGHFGMVRRTSGAGVSELDVSFPRSKILLD